MNGRDDSPGNDRNLRGFYAYKNTFDEDNVWLEIPKHGQDFSAISPILRESNKDTVTFVNTLDPYADPLSPELDDRLITPERSSSAQHHNGEWDMESQYHHAHGLEALSAAATANAYSYLPSGGSMAGHSMPFTEDDLRPSLQPPTPGHGSVPPPTSPPVSMNSSTNNLTFILNPTSSMTPPIDPNLQSPYEPQGSTYSNGTMASNALGQDMRPEANVETEHEVAFLLRHFAEAPGQWYDFAPPPPNFSSGKLTQRRMDLFDLGMYFAYYVPVKALSNPLLKYAACAYAAKHLGRVKGAKAIVGGICSKQASMELWPDAENVDWYWYGAKYYDKAISLLMETLQQDPSGTPLPSPGANLNHWQGQDSPDDDNLSRNKRRRTSEGRLPSTCSDELLAATAILCAHEFLDASGAAWARHLSGTKSLLDIAEVGMMPLETQSTPSSYQSPRCVKPTRARKAIFWNFARQDFLAACKCDSLSACMAVSS